MRLPAVVWRHCATWLAARDLVALGQSGRSLHQVAEDERLWAARLHADWPYHTSDDDQDVYRLGTYRQRALYGARVQEERRWQGRRGAAARQQTIALRWSGLCVVKVLACTTRRYVVAQGAWDLPDSKGPLHTLVFDAASGAPCARLPWAPRVVLADHWLVLALRGAQGRVYRLPEGLCQTTMDLTAGDPDSGPDDEHELLCAGPTHAAVCARREVLSLWELRTGRRTHSLDLLGAVPASVAAQRAWWRIEAVKGDWQTRRLAVAARVALSDLYQLQLWHLDTGACLETLETPLTRQSGRRAAVLCHDAPRGIVWVYAGASLHAWRLAARRVDTFAGVDFERPGRLLPLRCGLLALTLREARLWPVDTQGRPDAARTVRHPMPTGAQAVACDPHTLLAGHHHTLLRTDLALAALPRPWCCAVM